MKINWEADTPPVWLSALFALMAVMGIILGKDLPFGGVIVLLGAVSLGSCIFLMIIRILKNIR